ncbi:ABC transporter ATP-binding protein [Carnobacterium viridans]|uniref:Energy-coupling factor transport system ATP-binding protein n=1 Tax=Carnobacterium viridans TaxID=174587 RepID=A0A1H1AXC4_9LACT|nr:ABC transporter ATP-binding protein [Carnobacterium viridans]SDQ44355.1 energy-coupling factor transport system ATP-binding protein [Carnobacterium viridans]
MNQVAIEFKSYTFKYRSQTEPTLLDINLKIQAGEKVVIVGPSGSGKSTLAHCINGLVPFAYRGESSGACLINGKETNSLDIFQLSKMIGTVLQDLDGQFIGLTVGEDIAFALENDRVEQKKMHKRVTQVAGLVKIENLLNASTHELSGGQKQRVSMAGVLVDDVDILLFDEPLANLDPATGKHAIALIDDLQKQTDKTTIIIEHRLEDVLYRDVDRIIVMSEGRIVADAAPSELLATDVLAKSHLREPLYLKALQYAGVAISSEMSPEHIERITLTNQDEKKVRQWYQHPVQLVKDKKTETILQVENLSFHYPNAQHTLTDITFTIQKGEMVSIVGKNGAGKSTLSKLICGFERHQTGKIIYQDKDISKESITKRAEAIGLVMQNPNQMISKHLIFDEVALGLRLRNVKEDEIRQRVEKTLTICGLYAFRNWPISALSFGQKKRVTIAAILVLEPAVLVLDEPTAGQDFRHYTEIMSFLTELNQQGITILMITHDMHLMLEYTSRTLVIGEGKLLADASAIEVLANESLIAQANLTKTSLYQLAEKMSIADPQDFVSKFIHYDKGVRKTWQ